MVRMKPDDRHPSIPSQTHCHTQDSERKLLSVSARVYFKHVVLIDCHISSKQHVRAFDKVASMVDEVLRVIRERSFSDNTSNCQEPELTELYYKRTAGETVESENARKTRAVHLCNEVSYKRGAVRLGLKG